MCDFFLRDLKFFFTRMLLVSPFFLHFCYGCIVFVFTNPCFCLCSSLDNVEYLYCEREETLSTDRKAPFTIKI